MAERTCSFPGCEKRPHAHGLCGGHRQQMAKGRDLTPLNPARQNRGKPLAERFAMKVQKTDGCWLWTGASNHLGYGQIWVTEERRVVQAIRVSLRLHGVEVPADRDVDHLCRNKRCVNPEHLEPVTHAVNMARAPFTGRDWQAAKTHCPHGHEYTAGNTYLRRNASGTLSRECRTCRKARR